MTLRSIQNAIDGHLEAAERAEQSAWERTRWLAAALLSPYAQKGKTIKPTDLARFPWEEKVVQAPRRREMTPEQKEWRRRMDEMMRRQYEQQQQQQHGAEGS